MAEGRVLFSMKYDLGGSVEIEKHGEAAIQLLLKQQYPETRRLTDDLGVFHFSYLSRTLPSFHLASRTSSTPIGSFTMTIQLHCSGVIGFVVEFAKESATSSSELALELLRTYHLFVRDKALDYAIYLEAMGEVRGRLVSAVTPATPGHLDFRSDVAVIRAVLVDVTRKRVRYNFNDFRPIFVVDDQSYLESDLRLPLLSLTASEGLAMGSAGNLRNQTLSDRVCCNAWCFLIRASAWNQSLHEMFDHAHNAWFQLQGSIFETRDLEAFIDGGRDLNGWDLDNEIEEFLDYLEDRKNSMFATMFSALNVDFITKNAQLRDDLGVFMDELGVQRQLSILRDYTERISTYLRDRNERLNLSETRELGRRGKALELLFFLNTAAGIAVFAPTLYASDPRNRLVWNAPQVLAVASIGASVLLYMAILGLRKAFALRRSSHRAIRRFMG